MADLGFQTPPWEHLEKKLERELGRFEAKLDGLRSELVSEQRIQRLAILQINSRVAKLEESLERGREEGLLTQDDVRQALADAIQDVLNLRQVLLVLGIPSGVLGLLFVLSQLIGGL